MYQLLASYRASIETTLEISHTCDWSQYIHTRRSTHIIDWETCLWLLSVAIFGRVPLERIGCRVRSSRRLPLAPSDPMACHKVDAVVAFLNAAVKTMGSSDAWPGIVKSQVSAIVDFVGASPPTIQDASLALSSLSGPAAATVFSEADRSTIATAITTTAASATPSPSPVGAPSCARAGNQSHFFMYNYMTADDWSALLMQSLPTMKMKVIVERGLDLGLAYPSEKTIVSVVAIVIVASQTVISSAEGYNLLEQLKRMWKTSRQSRKVVTTCAHFPPAVEDFEKSYPGRYPDDSPPVISRLSIALIEDLRANLAARKTHRSLSATVQGLGRPQLQSLVVFPPKRPATPKQPLLGLTLAAHAASNGQRGLLPLQDACAHSTTSSAAPSSTVDTFRVDDAAASVPSSTMDDEDRASLGKLGDNEPQDETPERSRPSGGAASLSVIGKKHARKPAIVGNLDDLVRDFRQAVEKNTALKKDAAGSASKCSGKSKGTPQAKSSPSTASTSPVATDKRTHGDIDHEEKPASKRRVMQKTTPNAKSRIASTPNPQHQVVAGQTMTPPKPLKPSIAAKASPAGCALVVFSKPFITHEWSRQQVLARTGCRGAGNARAFKFEGKDSSTAKGEAIEWLSRRCAELGITWTPAAA